MTVQDFKTFYDYNYWANKKILPVISQLTTEEFTQSVAGGYGSIRNTMVHLLSTEWGWLSRCGGHQRGTSLKGDDYPTVKLLLDDWQKVEGYMREILSQLEDDDLNRTVEYRGQGTKNVQCPLESYYIIRLFMGPTIEGRLLCY